MLINLSNIKKNEMMVKMLLLLLMMIMKIMEMIKIMIMMMIELTFTREDADMVIKKRK